MSWVFSHDTGIDPQPRTPHLVRLPTRPPAQPHQLLGPQADEDALGVFTVVTALHQSQEQLGGVVLGERREGQATV